MFSHTIVKFELAAQKGIEREQLIKLLIFVRDFVRLPQKLENEFERDVFDHYLPVTSIAPFLIAYHFETQKSQKGPKVDFLSSFVHFCDFCVSKNNT